MRIIFSVLAMWVALGAASAQTASPTLFSFDPYFLRISKYWPPLSDLQSRLNEALTECGLRAGVVVDYRPGPRGVGAAIARLRTCEAYAIPGEEGSRALTQALWTRLWPEAPPPSLTERMRAFTFSFEATDYDRFLWNIAQPGDPHAFGTWGPFGATLAAGGEIQTIARVIEAETPGVFAAAFEAASAEASPLDPAHDWREGYCTNANRAAPTLTGAALLLQLEAPLRARDRNALRDEFCGENYRKWFGAFRTLGDNPAVRAAFDAHYARQNRRVVSALAAIYAERGWTPSEVDWGFFLDRGTQFTTDGSTIRAALDALPATATRAERRLAISLASRPTHAGQSRLRVARDLSFVLDDPVAAAAVSAEDRGHWSFFSKRLASQVGLSDEREVPTSPF